MAEQEKPSGSSSPSASPRSRKTLVGVVRGAKMQKTISVRVDRLEKHEKYGKYTARGTTYYAHDERGEARSGDRVRIEETRPLSRLKRWRLVEIVSRAKGAKISGEGLDIEPLESGAPGGATT
jgi:small subunit ribosomal protein S17